MTSEDDRRAFGDALRRTLNDSRAEPAGMSLLWQAFTRGEPTRRAPLEQLLGADVMRSAVTAGFVDEFTIDDEPWLRSTVCVVLVDLDGQYRWIASDFPWSEDSPGYVGGPGNATGTLLRVIRGIRWRGTAADLGTGSGAVAVDLAAAGHRVTALDLNPRALAYAELTATLNDADVSVRAADYAEPLAEPVDLWVANPAFVIGAPQTTMFRDSDGEGIEQVVDLGTAAARSLRPYGVAVLLGNWEYTSPGSAPAESIARRLQDAVPGLSVVHHERAVVPPERYVSVWSDDADEQAAWAHGLRDRGITAIGTGVLALRLDGDATVRIDRSLETPEIDLAAAVLGSWSERRRS